MVYRVIDMEQYYRRDVFTHFTKDARCSVSITQRLDVTALKAFSDRTGTKFYLNFLYILSRALNARDDYKLAWLPGNQKLICYDKINPTQYVFHKDTETFTIAYTEYHEDYRRFYAGALRDLNDAKHTREYRLDQRSHPNWFDASYLPWLSYDALHVELPDGHLYFNPIVNWGRYEQEHGVLKMPVTVRLNHAVADGYLVAKVFLLMEEEMRRLTEGIASR